MSEFAQGQYQFNPGQNVVQVTHGSDDGLYVEFFVEAVQNAFKSKEAGHAKFDDVPHISILFPGDKTKKIVRPVKMEDDVDGPSDLTRFPRQWAKFKANEEQVADGLPIQQWPPLSKSQALELKAMNIHTVEQLAVLPDASLTWLGARELRLQAQNWIDKAGAHAVGTRLTAENNQLKEQLAAMQRQVDELAAASKKKTKE